MNTPAYSVQIKDLELNFGAVKVLNKLNLDIGEGEFLVLLGSSGCGKSTLLNCIAGLLEISDGQIYIIFSGVIAGGPIGLDGRAIARCRAKAGPRAGSRI